MVGESRTVRQVNNVNAGNHNTCALRVAAHRPRNFYRLVAKHDTATFFICRATLLY